MNKLIFAISVLMGTSTVALASDNVLNDSIDSTKEVATKAWGATKTSAAETIPAITNEKDTWGSYDRSNQWYVGVGVDGYANWANTQGSNSGWNGIVGYNFNKYLGLQYNQFGTYNGMFGGIAEGILNVPTDTMFTPYASGGAGWANLAGKAMGAWSVGGGLKMDLSKHVQASVDYRYIQSIGPQPQTFVEGIQPNNRAGTNQIGAGLTWFFGDGGSSTSADAPMMATSSNHINESDYVLPEGIKQCADNFNLTEDGIACYTVNGDDVTVYLDTKFAYDSTALNTKGKNAIKSFVNFIDESGIDKVTVKGYASQGKVSPEHEEYNHKLSERRANEVADYMKQLGISADVDTKGFGYFKPLVPNTSVKNKKINQRVQSSVSAPLKKQ